MDSDVAREMDALRTRVRALEARLLDVTRAVAVAYHDLSNPLSALAGNTELLRILAGETVLDAEMQATVDDLVAAVAKLHAEMEHLRRLRQALREDLPL